MFNWFKKGNKEIAIMAPVDGKVIALEKVTDEIFAQKMLGDGFAIQPTSNNFLAPIDGELITVFPTGHAYGIRHKKGVELLLHIGIDTVNLKGEGFDIKVKQGENVKAGDLLAIVDLAKIKGKVPSLDSPLVFANEALKGRHIEVIKNGNVKAGEVVALIK